jgi:hypothetical protein
MMRDNAAITCHSRPCLRRVAAAFSIRIDDHPACMAYIKDCLAKPKHSVSTTLSADEWNHRRRLRLLATVLQINFSYQSHCMGYP